MNNIDEIEGGGDLPSSNANNHVVDADRPTPTTPSVTIQLPDDDDDNDAPLPIGMVESSFQDNDNTDKVSSSQAVENVAVGIEYIEDNTGPNHSVRDLAKMFEKKPNGTEARRREIARDIEHINNDSNNSRPPLPIAMIQDTIEATEIANKMSENVNELSTPIPSFNTEHIEEDEDEIVQDMVHISNREVIEGSDIERGEVNADGDIESQPQPYRIEQAAGGQQVVTIDDQVEEDMHEGGHNIVEAYAVDEDVYDATPLEPSKPWYKQKRTKIMLVVVFVIVGALAIALGVSLSSSSSSSNGKENAVVTTEIVTVDSTPSPSVSSAPSSSLIPSSSPTECVNHVSATEQKIDLKKDLQNSELSDYGTMAVDGRDMFVVVQNGLDLGGNNPGVLMLFFSLNNDDEWQRVGEPTQVDGVNNKYSVAASYAMAISGRTAFVGYPDADDGAGVVLVYEKNQIGGEWEKVDDPFVHPDVTRQQFGKEVALEDTLACVVDMFGAYFYYKDDNNKWVQFGSDLQGYKFCSISGDTIVIQDYVLELGSPAFTFYGYGYNADSKSAIKIQDPIPVESPISFDLSNDFLAYWDMDLEDVFIYERDGTNQTFAFHQQLNISGPKQNSLAIDNDILVVGGIGRTHIFSLKNGNWIETITLEEAYTYHQISDSNLLVRNENGIFSSFNVKDCVERPTQTPTRSISPTTSPPPSTSFSIPYVPGSSTVVSESWPTYMPSTSSPTLPPSTSPIFTPFVASLSASPTGICYPIVIAITYDKYPSDTSWEIYRVSGSGDDLVKSYNNSSDGDTVYTESVCLPGGEYEFIIRDVYGDGICCEWGEGQYNITTNGQLVVEGGEFGKSEGTLFSLPFSSNGMTEEDKMWLTSHNSRRKKWHEEAGVEYKALKWSYALSDESKVWAEKLLDENCESLVLYHDPDNIHGENLAGHSTGIIELEQTPEDVVERWVEGEEGLIWPGNIHLTQVLWRPTTHVGCAMASRSKSGGEGGTCATQVCRYARPANCNMDDYKTSDNDWWRVPMLKDDSICTPICPPDGC